ncbi:hypothetical protein AUEXF2481DRAFT_8035 [Aureobasidium subglaciale EXF-2481]|uniref:Uncharacterized protein n=1 Tax=Aureobasidium subglaciale (strain EXF-2481) TaxID=1043005 RepID=A0A074YZ10_AURSE|nr:uncharacterized protein AUEXF2481DRAFT_8035 [Aureobasidium subglaciale EXF-2481]KAI5207335.1 hypothetical protein E4T38_03388 [Aureobasidium subglaciale]KAI5226120.1 hypothetical protein E4T40_03234 [Aureobasidium subglaciale]KAI5229454.1 hypothetical protein E4T41_03385 [Aureobasidium subglaciale]KAI5264250.1 hypothetical protein E4T46_03163 [Aureobasidium subglaciale]KEQ92066.1 hypothetical protein AUEXF2481DRAFT_8035 [Aureobasidium subglaciale EXF-2481]
MKYSFALAALATVVAASDSPLLTRQTDNTEEYIREVCFPNTTSPIPPCQQIINIESACQPNGTAPLDYSAHQQCMCNGGYFPNWSGCLNCQYVHGTRSEAVAQANEAIISSASSAFCTGTPTAVFASYFSSISDESPQTATGAATTLSDQYPSQSAVSLYYTASGNQGVGAVTGSAAQATAAVSSSATRSSSASLAASAATTTGASSSTGSSSSRQSSSSSRSSSGSQVSSSVASSASSASGAATGAANAVVVSEGMLAFVAGAMMLL